jgi:hypothetical protein
MRTTRKDLDALVGELNEELGRPAKGYDPERRKFSIGHFCIYKTVFGYELHENRSDSGAIRCHGGCHQTAREFATYLRGMLNGVSVAQKSVCSV